jgi:hypothetical protein
MIVKLRSRVFEQGNWNGDHRTKGFYIIEDYNMYIIRNQNPGEVWIRRLFYLQPETPHTGKQVIGAYVGCSEDGGAVQLMSPTLVEDSLSEMSCCGQGRLAYDLSAPAGVSCHDTFNCCDRCDATNSNWMHLFAQIATLLLISGDWTLRRKGRLELREFEIKVWREYLNPRERK